MESPYETSRIGNNEEAYSGSLQIIKYTPFRPCTNLPSPWFDLRVFYVRVINFLVDDSTPESLTLIHIPLNPDTFLEINGSRSSIYSDGVSSLLRRNRVDKNSEEATFVSTDSVRLTGSVKFELFDKEYLIMSGVLEMSNSNGVTGDIKGNGKRWSMNCDSVITAGSGFLKGKHILSHELSLPTLEVYVAGCFSGKPVILTKTLQLSFRKKHNRMGALDVIPEYETTDQSQKDSSPGHDLQVAEYKDYKPQADEDYSNIYRLRTGYMEGEDGELSWFNDGVRVGVGIGLGICLGIGIGVGLLVRTYQTTTRNFRRRLL